MSSKTIVIASFIFMVGLVICLIIAGFQAMASEVDKYDFVRKERSDRVYSSYDQYEQFVRRNP